MAASGSDNVRVSDIFDEGFKLFSSVTKSNEPTNSGTYQTQVKKSMHLLEDATRMVSLTGMFSTNESVEEVSTSDIKFFLLPALLGTLSLKLCFDNRMEVVHTAEVYFRDFLQRCKNYGIINMEIPQPQCESAEPKEGNGDHQQFAKTDVLALARQRSAKLQRYREQKELEAEVEMLRLNLTNKNVDDEVKRKYYLTLIKMFANQALDELHSIEMEKPLIEHMDRLKKGMLPEQAECKGRRRPQHPPLRPVIITRDEIQKKVFGAGYPSLPVMSVQEFYEKRVKDGDFPDPTKAAMLSLQEMAIKGIDENAQEEAAAKEREMKIEGDDEQALRQARDWDEFKDEHRRGFGNRMNRS